MWEKLRDPGYHPVLPVPHPVFPNPCPLPRVGQQAQQPKRLRRATVPQALPYPLSTLLWKEPATLT